jgi:hypothetical protein
MAHLFSQKFLFQIDQITQACRQMALGDFSFKLKMEKHTYK